MKKSLFCTVLFAFVMFTDANAILKFGVRAGVDVMRFSASKVDLDPVNFTSLSIGPVLDVNLPIIGVEAAALVSKRLSVDKDASGKYAVHGFGFERQDVMLTVPVMLKYGIGALDLVKFFLAAGADASVMFKNNDIINEVKDKNFRVGIDFGLGVVLFKRVQVGANYRIGLTDDFKSFDSPIIKDLKGKSGTWSLSATYFF
ncbi:MAG: PorT family protein [Dysgonamonadaceae bacterium]|nr:PorT family protein [Dysgonamonadaceae bacterium]